MYVEWMRIELPPALAQDIEEVYEEQGYGSTTAFVRDTLRQEIDKIRYD